jgi:hypothetical protein
MSILDHAIPVLLFYGVTINFLLISYDFLMIFPSWLISGKSKVHTKES